MRTEELDRIKKERNLDLVVVTGPKNIRALTGIEIDRGVLTEKALYTDFRYVPAVHRIAPGLKTADVKRFKLRGKRIGVEYSMPHDAFLRFRKRAGGAKLVDISSDLKAVRMVKTPEEIEKLRAAELLTCRIWREACAKFKAGMTERQMAAQIRKLMVVLGDGEAFDTIVCVGKNAAECHHVPDDTVWNGKDPVLVDMGVKLNGYSSDLTRNLVPEGSRPSRLYRRIYSLVLKANLAAIAALKPGMTGRALDQVARRVISKGGFGKCFGHSLGHGVGLDIHEEPYVSKKGDTVLKPGMLVTIEPGIYLEGNLGVRIEDLVLVTETGCEVLSPAPKDILP